MINITLQTGRFNCFTDHWIKEANKQGIILVYKTSFCLKTCSCLFPLQFTENFFLGALWRDSQNSRQKSGPAFLLCRSLKPLFLFSQLSPKSTFLWILVEELLRKLPADHSSKLTSVQCSPPELTIPNVTSPKQHTQISITILNSPTPIESPL